MVFYLILADIIVGIHLAYVGYVVIGEMLIVAGIPLRWKWIRNFWFRISHLVMILIVAVEATIKFECPLTTWEYQLLEAAGQPAESRSFVGRLMNNLLFFDCPDESWVWPWIYGGVAGMIVLTFVFAPPRLKKNGVNVESKVDGSISRTRDGGFVEEEGSTHYLP